MADKSSAWRIATITFAIIGLIVVVALIGMWALHGSMRGMMGAGNMNQKMVSVYSGILVAKHRC